MYNSEIREGKTKYKNTACINFLKNILGFPLEMEFQLQQGALKIYYCYTLRAKRRDDFISKSLDEHLDDADSNTRFVRIFQSAISK